jgi:hypothetical protein
MGIFMLKSTTITLKHTNGGLIRYELMVATFFYWFFF